MVTELDQRNKEKKRIIFVSFDNSDVKWLVCNNNGDRKIGQSYERSLTHIKIDQNENNDQKTKKKINNWKKLHYFIEIKKSISVQEKSPISYRNEIENYDLPADQKYLCQLLLLAYWTSVTRSVCSSVRFLQYGRYSTCLRALFVCFEIAKA